MSQQRRSMYTEIDIETWPRRATYEFFKDYEDPFFNFTANLDVTELYHFCKRSQLAYSLAALHCCQSAANEIREFRTRLLDDRLVEYKRIDITQTILNDDETFSFSYYQMRDDIFEFERHAQIARDHYRKLKTFDVETHRLDLIYYSVIPWVSFTSFKHASRLDRRQTVPRIVFGKMFDAAERKMMPLSVEANHTIMDGFHVGKLFNRFQEIVDSLKQS
ncbi:MAG TPA: CatA-like O-acetyltransferase [Pyrinomonadaceae bacterium]